MGIEQAFGLGGPAEVIVVGQKADYRPYELRIAKLEGAVRGYQEGIAELTAVAQLNKDLATRNRILVDLYKDTFREFITEGRLNREEINARRKKLEGLLPQEDIETLAQFR